VTQESIAYDPKELKALSRQWKYMDETALKATKEAGYELSTFVAGEVKKAGYGRYVNAAGVKRLVDGASVSKSSKVGEISYGFARQRFSGGGTTRSLWPGLEFGSKRFRQFPAYSGRFGRGGKGYFIYPTLRKLQPELVRKWEQRLDEIIKGWGSR